ncbi:MAG: protein translocase subunit SecF [Bacillota bacterium]
MTRTQFDIIGKRRLFFVISLVIIGAGLVSLLFQGLNLGVDFAGGTSMQFHVNRQFETAEVREALTKAGFGGAEIRKVGAAKDADRRDVEIRLGSNEKGETGLTTEERKQITQEIEAKFGKDNIQLMSDVTVPPRFGREATSKAIIALNLASLGIIAYCAVRFEIRPAVATVVAVLHDVLVVVGMFSIFRVEVDLTFVAALLTIVGYSVNDTIVIFDRVREDMRNAGRNVDFAKIVNQSLWQSMTRTLYTSLTVFFTVLAIFVWGGVTTRNFALAMLIGLISGTYSTVFIASAIWVEWRERSTAKQQKQPAAVASGGRR